jgi:hypothetical protein
MKLASTPAIVAILASATLATLSAGCHNDKVAIGQQNSGGQISDANPAAGGASGGASSAGGAVASGGAKTGGATGVGGAIGAGGASESGGNAKTGGTTSAGGAIGTGGAKRERGNPRIGWLGSRWRYQVRRRLRPRLDDVLRSVLQSASRDLRAVLGNRRHRSDRRRAGHWRSGGAGSGGGARGGAVDAGDLPGGEDSGALGVTAGTGSCFTGGCPGSACPPSDAGTATRPQEPAARSRPRRHATTEAIAIRSSRIPTPVGAPVSGCCMHFNRCADGGHANCSGGPIACAGAARSCAPPYALSYANNCFEGCVLQTECAGVRRRRHHPGVSADRPRQWFFLREHQPVLFLRQLPEHGPNPGHLHGRHVVGPNCGLRQCQLSRVARGHYLPVWTALFDCGKRNHRRSVREQHLRPGTDFSGMCIRSCWMCCECHPQRRSDHYLQPVSPGRLRLVNAMAPWFETLAGFSEI